jgi:tetratricopeptide (TPR) repeat protein
MPRAPLTLLMALATLGACSAMGVAESSDPAIKLRQANELFVKEDRPVPAERLIHEALEIYEKNGDQLGMAEAFRTYGFFYRSTAVERWEKVYRAETGFFDKSVRFDERFQKSAEYFEKSATTFERAGAPDRAVNAEFNRGMTYFFAKDTAGACEAYDKSLVMYRHAQEIEPDKKPELPPGVNSFDELVRRFKAKVPCDS